MAVFEQWLVKTCLIAYWCAQDPKSERKSFHNIHFKRPRFGKKGWGRRELEAGSLRSEVGSRKDAMPAIGASF